MNARKNWISVFLLLALLVCALPFSAEAAGTGQIETVPITFSMPPVVAGEVSGVSATLKAAGCYISGISWHDMYGQPMTNVFTYDNATVVITVNASPGWFFSGNVQVSINGEYAPFENHGSQLVISRTYSPVVWAPNVVKHPSSETVMEGGLVSFVSYGAFVDEYSWTIIDTEGKHYSIDALAEKFPQLQFYTSFGKLNMGPIPMAMNGYKVRCSFTGPGGSVNSGYADIIVEQPLPADSGQSAATQALPEHIHNYSTELSSDAGYHWYGCDCGDSSQKEVHKFTWIQKREASLKAPGLVQGECAVCGYMLNCRTQLDPSVAEKLREEAEAAAAPSPSPDPETKPGRKGKISGLFEFFKADVKEYTPE